MGERGKSAGQIMKKHPKGLHHDLATPLSAVHVWSLTFLGCKGANQAIGQRDTLAAVALNKVLGPS